MSRPLSRRQLLAAVGGLTAVAALGWAAPRGTAHSAAPQLEPVDHWEREFAASPSRDHYLQLAGTSEPQNYYQLAYGVDAYTMMFEATAKTAYLDTALQFAERMIGQARPSSSFPTSAYRDDYLAWISHKETNMSAEASDVDGQEVPLYESYCWRYVFRTLRVMRDSSVLGTAPWRGRYDAVLAFGERNIFDKWYTRGANDNIYRSRTHMASHWAFIATDLEVMTADPERAARCREIYQAIDRKLPNYPSSLRDQLHPAGRDAGAYDWSDVWGARVPSQDVSHGNNVVAYVVEAHDRGREWDVADVRRFTGTLGVIWPTGQDGVAEFVDGTGTGDGWLSDGFVKLGRYDPLVQERLEGHRVRDAQFVAALALNSRRLTAP